ncbi:MAG UNVERIFIED_CONTAM: HEAT repeat domain-containing protein [Planctomycetaceae bacterium]|jgi:HEAT repeat protein
MKFLALFFSVFSPILLTQIAVSHSSEPRTRGAADEDSPAIVKLVAGLFDEQNTAACAQLEKIGKPAVPALIRALSDPRTTSVNFEFRGFHPGGYSPFERITSLLEPFAPSDAVRPLENCLQHQDSDFRKTAAQALGNIGTADCISPVLRALQDPDDYVRAYAMSGIDRGMNADRCTRNFSMQYFLFWRKYSTAAKTCISSQHPRSCSE